MLVQPSRTATVCEVDRARKRAASRKRAQNLGSRTNNRWRFITPKTIHLTLTCSCEACSGFTRVAAHRIAQLPKATFVTRLRPGQSPTQTARQLPDQSTSIWVEPSSTGVTRLRGAL